MNDRCHNDPMDFADDVCDSCGEPFCQSCLVYPRGARKAPLCTRCAMALSGVRNRRPAKQISRSEVKRRRKQLQEVIATAEVRVPVSFSGADLIAGPELEEASELDEPPAIEERRKRSVASRFRRRKTDRHPAPAESTTPPPTTLPEIADPADDVWADDDTPEDDVSSAPEHSAAAILEQLRESDETADGGDDVWLPPVQAETSTWTLPDLSASTVQGPWGSVANAVVDDAPDAPEPVDDAATGDDMSPPTFVSEAQLKALGPADKDLSGNWVPPVLRGMAPEAKRGTAKLAHRRRRNDNGETRPELDDTAGPAPTDADPWMDR